MPFIDRSIKRPTIGTPLPTAFGDTVGYTIAYTEHLILGDLVYITENKIDELYEAKKIDITDRLAMPVAGMVTEILTRSTAMIVCNGEVTDVCNNLIPGRTCFAGLDSRLSLTVPPRPTAGICFIQPIAYVLRPTTLIIRLERPIVLVAD